jgi:AAA domain
MSEILTVNAMLPTTRAKATRLSPRILVLYGLPKVGKTKVLTELDGCIILDTEDGVGMYEALSVPIRSMRELYKFIDAVEAEGVARAKQGIKGDALYPYRYIALDTLDMLEDFAETEATVKYKESTQGKDFKGKSVLELAHGLGYWYLRTEVLEAIRRLSQVCRNLILNVHVKEKLLDKKGEQVKSNDIALTGRLGSMVCSKADAIGYMYREVDKNGADHLKVSFATSEDQIMGARQPYLAGQKFDFDWSKIFID